MGRAGRGCSCQTMSPLYCETRAGASRLAKTHGPGTSCRLRQEGAAADEGPGHFEGSGLTQSSCRAPRSAWPTTCRRLRFRGLLRLTAVKRALRLPPRKFLVQAPQDRCSAPVQARPPLPHLCLQKGRVQAPRQVCSSISVHTWSSQAPGKTVH